MSQVAVWPLAKLFLECAAKVNETAIIKLSRVNPLRLSG